MSNKGSSWFSRLLGKMAPGPPAVSGRRVPPPIADPHGSLQACDQAIADYERLVNREGRIDLAEALALAYTNKAAVARALGDKKGAVALYDQAIAIYKRLADQQRRAEFFTKLGDTHSAKGDTLTEMAQEASARKPIQV